MDFLSRFKRVRRHRTESPVTIQHPSESLKTNSEESDSLLIQAALEGDTALISILLKEGIDVNQTTLLYPGHIPSCLHSVHSQNITALYAAVCNGHFEVVQMLLKSGASVNIASCQQVTPLHEAAAAQKNMKVMKALHKHGARLDVFDRYGLSPLCVALISKNVDAVRYLLKAGANALPPNHASLSAMHFAAAGGHVECVRLLLSQRVSPMFTEPSHLSVPCPLYIAAVCGHFDIVKELTAHPKCPLACKADALLLLGAQQIINKSQDGQTRELWMEALRIKKECHHILKFPPMLAFNEAMEFEIQHVDDVDQLFDSGSSEAIRLQSLIIMERCIGFMYIHDFSKGQTAWCILDHIVTAHYSLSEDPIDQDKSLEEFVMKLFISLEKTVSHRANYPYLCNNVSYQMFARVELVFRTISTCIQQLLKNALVTPQFQQYIFWTLRIIGSMQIACTTHATVAPCGRDLSQSILGVYQQMMYGIVLVLFLRWLQLEKSERNVLSCACITTGINFVTNHLYLSTMSECTLLNFALCNPYNADVSWQEKKTVEFLDHDLLVLNHASKERLFTHDLIKPNELYIVILALLMWGADTVVNTPDSKGQRPLHLAAKLKVNGAVIFWLQDNGAHFDAVNAEGKTFYEINHGLPSHPLRLVCQASRKIVAENFHYEKLDLPQHVKRFISLHDPKPRIVL